MIRKHCKMVLSFAAAILSFFAFADRASVKAAMKFATGGDVTRFRYTDPSSGVGYTAFVHTFTNTAAAAEFQNMSGKTLPVRLLVVGGGGAGMDGYKGAPSKYVYGGGGGGGGGVTETNAFLSAGDVWTIRVGAGGSITNHSYKVARGAAGTSSVSNEVAELVLTPGGGAGGSRVDTINGVSPTAGAAGGGGSGETDADRNGATGTYTSSTLFAGEMGVENPTGGKGGSKSYGGGGGGAGANGNNKTGGAGLTSNITGNEVVYGSGGGGGGFCRGGSINAGGLGGENAGVGGTGDATSITPAQAPVANTGSGGAGGISFGGDAYSAVDASCADGTPGADGVVIIRYDIPDTPCVGGDVVTVTTNGYRATYVHMFTNTTTVATFTPSVAFDGTSVRMLVVGGGGAGMDGYKGVPSKYVYGGGGGGGGGVTETNAFLSAGDVWTIRVGAGGSITNHSYKVARGAAGTSSVSNEVAELVLTPGGGAGGSRVDTINGVSPTAGAAGGGGSGETDADRNGATGTYTSSTLFAGEMGVENPTGGKGGSKSYGGGGGGAGANGNNKTGGAGLTSNITGNEVVYGSGGGGGGCFRLDKPTAVAGGNGGENAGNGGTGASSDNNLTITPATENPPAPNTGSGGGGGVSFGGSANDGVLADELAWGTSGADGVVIIRYEVDLPRPNGFMVIVY